jgi:hypothetical protein
MANEIQIKTDNEDNEFFKRVRARFYILSTTEPSQTVLNALLDATWDLNEFENFYLVSSPKIRVLN